LSPELLHVFLSVESTSNGGFKKPDTEVSRSYFASELQHANNKTQKDQIADCLLFQV
jgi:hypothetical protein